MKYNINELKKEAGEIPENTCPDIDKALEELAGFEKELAYLQKYTNRFESVEEFAKALPDLGWADTPRILEDLRSDNERLRFLGKFWYEKCVEILEELDN